MDCSNYTEKGFLGVITRLIGAVFPDHPSNH